MFEHHTKNKGDLGLMKVKLDLFEKGYLVLSPETEHSPFDVVGYKDSKFIRVQVKYRALKDDVVVLPVNTSWADKNGSHSKKYDLESIDIFALYVPDLDKCFYIPSGLLFSKSSNMKLRVTSPKNNQSNYNNLFDFQDILNC